MALSCPHCGDKLSSKCTLKSHIEKNKKCLAVQSCDKLLSDKHNINQQLEVCTEQWTSKYKILEEENQALKQTIEQLKREYECGIFEMKREYEGKLSEMKGINKAERLKIKKECMMEMIYIDRGLCPHGREKKSQCPGCIIKRRCPHGLPKSKCKECGICPHCRQKRQCYICSPNSPVFCISCHLFWVGTYKPYCRSCYYAEHPDEAPPNRYMKKELALRESLSSFLGPYTPQFNKVISNTCGILSRPDIFLELKKHCIVIECDEDQHKGQTYIPECENARNNNLTYICGEKPLVVIRFNPDSYIDEEKHPSCFTVTKTGLLLHPERWDERINELKDTLEYYIKTVPEQPFTEVKICFDFDPNSESEYSEPEC